MRLSEMIDEQLIKQVKDDALAREIFSRLVLSKLRVSDEVQALEHQRDKVRSDYEKAMHQINRYEKAVECYKADLTTAQSTLKHVVLASPDRQVAVHSDFLKIHPNNVTLQWHTEERIDTDGWFYIVEAEAS